MIAVTGASGHLGRLVVQELKAFVGAENIVALARKPERVADLGVAAREADYTRKETLDKALAGVERLVLISSNEIGQRAVQHANVIAAAKKAGVKFIAYTSLLHTDTSVLNLVDEHRVTEADLARSGIPHAILRNGWYTENYENGIRGAAATGVLLGAAGEGRISSAPRADYARTAAIVVSGKGHEGKVYELAGDKSFTMADLAATVANVAGRAVEYRNLSEAAYAEALASAGIPAGFAKIIASWDPATEKGALFDDGHALSRLIGRPTTPLESVVSRILGK